MSSETANAETVERNIGDHYWKSIIIASVVILCVHLATKKDYSYSALDGIWSFDRRNILVTRVYDRYPVAGFSVMDADTYEPLGEITSSVQAELAWKGKTNLKGSLAGDRMIFDDGRTFCRKI